MTDPRIVTLEGFQGGWNSNEPTVIDDNQLSEATNFYYDNQQNLTTRRGLSNFGNEIPTVDNMHSIYFVKLSSGDRYLLCGAGTKVYQYNESTEDWDVLKTGLTDGLRLSFATYKDVIYWTNGTDNFMSYDGSTVSEHASVEKGKYLIIANDVAYLGHINNDKSVVFYTNTNPADLTSFPNFIPINEDDGQVITGLQNQGPMILAGKEQSIYSLNIGVESDDVDSLDYSGGVASHRSWQKVENDTLYLSDRGVYSLVQRRGTTGSLRAMALTNDLQNVINSIGDFTIAAAFYSRKKSNYYLAVDEDGGGRNKALLVRNTVAGHTKATYGWTKYNGVNANDFCEYEDADGGTHILVANAFGGQCLEIETGFNDNDISIRCTAKTKTLDYGNPAILKTFTHVDLIGLISVQGEVRVTIDIDGYEYTKTLYGSDYADPSVIGLGTIGKNTIGTKSLSGEPSGDDMPTYNFTWRFPLYISGYRISIKMESDILNAKFQPLRVDTGVQYHEVDVFNNNYIA